MAYYHLWGGGRVSYRRNQHDFRRCSFAAHVWFVPVAFNCFFPFDYRNNAESCVNKEKRRGSKQGLGSLETANYWKNSTSRSTIDVELEIRSSSGEECKASDAVHKISERTNFSKREKRSVQLIQCILRPLLKVIYIRRPPTLPPIKNPLLNLTASTLARKIRHLELSSQTVVEAYIERIKEVNPLINAVVEDRFEAAINDAKICDENLKAGKVTVDVLEKEQPLYGVPVTIKECCSLEGMSSTGGTWTMKGAKAAEDGEAVKLLKKAGAIPLCLTNIPELCLGLHTENFLFGSTKNPYDTRKTPGGSSGGEGALIAAGGSILGLGTDALGSIRLPSFFNGIFGHKPTGGIVPVQGLFPDLTNTPLQPLAVCGPMARYTEDLYLAMKVLSVNCERPLRLDEPMDLKNLRVYYVNNINSFLGMRATTSDIRQTIKVAARYLAQKGAHVEKLSQDWVRDSFMLLLAVFCETGLPELLLDDKHSDKKRRPLLEHLKTVVGLSNYSFQLTQTRLLVEYHGFLPRSGLDLYRATREDTRRKLTTLLGSDGVIICPTFPHSADLTQLARLQVDCLSYCTLCSVLQLPSTHVPMGLDDKGLPIGFQVMAAAYEDRLCLAVAKELEQAFGGWRPPS